MNKKNTLFIFIYLFFQRIIIENSENISNKKLIESKILELLQTTEGGKMLEDETLINTLTDSRSNSIEIEEKMKLSKIAEERINLNRANYESLAKLASNLYFVLLQICNLDPMYEFPLDFYIKLFRKAIKTAEKPVPRNLKFRLENLTESLKRHVLF